jgi:hypothetical protein
MVSAIAEGERTRTVRVDPSRRARFTNLSVWHDSLVLSKRRAWLERL